MKIKEPVYPTTAFGLLKEGDLFYFMKIAFLKIKPVTDFNEVESYTDETNDACYTAVELATGELYYIGDCVPVEYLKGELLCEFATKE